MTTPRNEDKLSLRQIVTSTLAAAFGVQSRGNLQRDFKAGKPLHFIIAGILFTITFILAIVALVHWVI